MDSILRKMDSKIVRQRNPNRHRRWYCSSKIDLLVDMDRKTGNLVSFELDWENSSELRPYVRWGRGVGLTTGRLDTGDTLGALKYKSSPIVFLDDQLIPKRVFAAREVVKRSGIHPELIENLLDRLRG